GLYPTAADLRRHRRHRAALPYRRPVGDRSAAPTASVRAGAVAAGARRAVEPDAQRARLCRLLAAARADADRTAAGQHLRAAGIRADPAEFPAVALVGQ